LYEATHLLFPNKPAGLRERASRAFSHGEARTVCEAWAKGNGLNDLATDPIEAELQGVAAALVNLQEQRHRADYDLTQTFDRLQVLEGIDQAENAMADWKHVKGSVNANVFLSSLLLHSRCSKYNK
jgi:hypothetical protein